MSVILVRERPSLRLAARVKGTSGRIYRWAADEPDAGDALREITLSDTMPGGFDQASGKLTRDSSVNYDDLQQFATIRFDGPSGCAWEGRLESFPASSGEQMEIGPGAVGHQAALNDVTDVVVVFVDIDQSHWENATSARESQLQSWAVDYETPGGATPDTDADGKKTGHSDFKTQLTGAWSRARSSSAWYDAKGTDIGSLYYAWKASPTSYPAYGVIDWTVYLSNDDVGTAAESPGNLQAAGPGRGTQIAMTPGKKWASVETTCLVAAGGEGIEYQIYWTCLAVYGNHGLAKQGVGDYQNAPGILASDAASYAVGKWTYLRTTKGGASTIQPSTFSIPQLAFIEPTTVSEIIKQGARFELPDWAVWEGLRIGEPTFFYNARNEGGRRWRARVGPSGLEETGRQADKAWNSVVVVYRDVSGQTRSVGPPGSNASATDASLVDVDPLNPANAAGINRRGVVTMEISTDQGAIKVGQTFLAQSRLLSTAGQARLTGHVEDEYGVLWPVSMVRAGDQIMFMDAHETGWRRIAKKSYNHAQKQASIDLDQPPEGLQELLERYGASILPLGVR